MHERALEQSVRIAYFTIDTGICHIERYSSTHAVPDQQDIADSIT
jgi:hypothetical protein